MRDVSYHIFKHQEETGKEDVQRKVFNEMFGNVIKHGLECLMSLLNRS